jgi:DNA-binding IclR family transcriptional regulator
LQVFILKSFAVPVFNNEGKICFTVSVHAPTARKSLDDLGEHIPALQKAARAMEDNYCKAIKETQD